MTTTTTKGRERREKILQAIHAVSDGSTKLCPYEDIVVKAWLMWPEEFGLRGYVTEYPDSSDLHKPLYGPLKREGLVRSANKRFGLTERGLSTVERLQRGANTDSEAGRGRLERAERAEILRLGDSRAVRVLSTSGGLLDTDLYDFYGVTVRTNTTDFVGRLTTVDAAIDAAITAKDPSIDLETVALVATTRDSLREKFTDLIAARAAAKRKLKG